MNTDSLEPCVLVLALGRTCKMGSQDSGALFLSCLHLSGGASSLLLLTFPACKKGTVILETGVAETAMEHCCELVEAFKTLLGKACCIANTVQHCQCSSPVQPVW